MNKEKSIEQLKKIILSYGLTYEKIEALTMAIEALEQKPPVISDDEIESESFKQSNNPPYNVGFYDGMIEMRKLLTNK